MASTVDQTWVYRFNDMLNLTFQQFASVVRPLIDPGMIHYDVSAAIDHHERLSNVIANDVVSPFGSTVPLNPAHSRRATTLVSSDATVLISDEHTLRAMVNPNSGYTRTILGALSRRADKHIIDNLIGSASTASVTVGSGVITYGSTALPAGRQIGAASAMDLARVVNANELLSKASAPNGMGERIFLYSPGQLRDILAITQASSSDFTKNQIHDRGTINDVMWQGFKWVEVADVVDADSSTVLGRMLPVPSYRQCIAFHKGSVGLSIGKDITTVVDPRPDLQSRPTQVRSAMMMSAVRVWEGGVVEVRALEN